jgi:hypothetical protein
VTAPLTEIDPEKDSVVLTPGVVGVTGTVLGLSHATMTRQGRMTAKMNWSVRCLKCMIDPLSNGHTPQHSSDGSLPATV